MLSTTGKLTFNKRSFKRSHQRYIFPAKSASVFLMIFVFLLSAFGQANRQVPHNLTSAASAPGTAAGSYGLSGFESVNPFSGKVNFSLPLLKIGGRGNAGYSMNLSIQRNWFITHAIEDFNQYSQGNSERYVIKHSYTPSDEDGDLTYGYTTDLTAGFMKGRRVGTNRNFYRVCTGNQPCYDEVLTRLSFVQPDGSEIEFRDVAKGGKASGPYESSLSRGTHWVSTDGSNATFISSADIYDQRIKSSFASAFYPSGTLYLANGTKYAIQDGRVQEIIDINGNRVTPGVDTLGREVTVTGNNNPAPSIIRNTVLNFKGTNGAARTIKINYSFLEQRLSAGYILEDLWNLFPKSRRPEGTGIVMYNPEVAASVELPDGRKYEFRYNNYGELTEITLPTGGRIEYVWQSAPGDYGYPEPAEVIPNLNAPPPDDSANLTVYRRVEKRRMYEAGVLQNETVYGAAEVTGNDSSVTVWNYAKQEANLVLVNKSKHYYGGSPVPNLLIPFHPTEDKGLLYGREMKTETYNSANVLLGRTETLWEAGTPLSANTAAEINGRVKEIKTTLADTNQISKKTFAYDGFNNQTDVYEYDFGNGTAGTTLLRRTHTDYLADTDYTAYTGAHLRSLPTQSWVSSDLLGNNKVSFTNIEYDNYNQITSDTNHASLTIRDNVTGRAATGFGTDYYKRGNVTAVKSYAIVGNESSAVSVYTQYDILGNVVKTKDAKGNVSTVSYEDNFGFPNGEAQTNVVPAELAPTTTYPNGLKTYAFPTSATNALEWVTGYSQVDYYTGKAVDSEDINGNVSSVFYNDALDRPTQVIAANNRPTLRSQQTFLYDDDAADRKVTTTADLYSFDDNLSKAESFYDTLGRTTETRSYRDDGHVVSETKYDGLGRAYKQSNPYRPTEITTSNPIRWTTSRFDDIGRIEEVETPDGAKVKTDYHGTRTLVTDQAGKQRISRVNALGQLSDVWEVTASDTSTVAVSFPNQTLSAGYHTSYAYDLLNNLTQVTQGAQTRTFVYDSLSRLKQATNPELGTTPTNGTIYYIYDNNGNLTQKTDPRQVVTTYVYDNLNRVSSRSYSAPQNLQNYQASLPVAYTYDNLPNSKGRLTKVATGNTASPFSITDYQAFDQLGRVTQSQQTTDGVMPDPMTYTYNLSGALVEQKYPSGRVVKNVLDNDGDLSIVQSKKNANSGFWNYADSFTYTTAGAVSSMQLGNGRWESTVFNERLQPTQIALGTIQNGADKLKLNFTYNTPNVADNNGNVLSQTITVPTVGTTQGFTAIQTYTYDSLNRLKSATENIGTTQNWKQTYLYDRYGNRNFDEGGTSGNYLTTTLSRNCPTSTYNPNGICDKKVSNPTIAANNRIVQDQEGDTQNDYLYDAAGNTTRNALGEQFTYDAENKQTQFYLAGNNPINNNPDARYFYDGDGKRVKKVAGGEVTIFVYDASGKLVAEYANQIATLSEAKVSYLTSDHLGSPRITTDASGGVISRRDFMPFGEEISSAQTAQRNINLHYGADNVRQKFTGYERDIESELDFAEARYYNFNHGRFTGVDPLLESAQPSLPQTWNRYAYCLNNPLNAVDPTGMMTDFVNEQTGQRSRIEDGRDQVLVASTDTINLYFKTWNENRDMYFAGLSLLEKNENANLHLTTSEFTARVQTTYGESSAFRMNAGEELSNEMKAIAYVNQRNGVAYGDKSPQGLDYENTSIDKETDKMKLGNLAVVNQVRGGPDPSNGATGWDGREQALFPDKDKRASVPNGRGGTWELRKNTGGWSISDADYAKWKQNVGSAFKAPQYSVASSGRNKGQVRYYSTAVYGNTIFWRIK